MKPWVPRPHHHLGIKDNSIMSRRLGDNFIKYPILGMSFPSAHSVICGVSSPSQMLNIGNVD